MIRPLILLFALLLSPLGAFAQSLWPPTSVADSRAHQKILEAADQALKRGDSKTARHHLLRALWSNPHDPGALRRLLLLTRKQKQARTLWSLHTAASLADARGLFKPSSSLKSLLSADDPFLMQIPEARARAVEELARAAGKLQVGKRPSDHLLARWYALAAHELVRRQPALARRFASLFNGTTRPFAPPLKKLAASLKGLLGKAAGASNWGQAVLMARCLEGFAAQAGYKTLKGPKPPDLKALGQQAAASLHRARTQLAQKLEKPLSVAELLALSPAQQAAFTKLHASLAHPGVALSPEGRYRIETNAGFETLLGVARTIEKHHQRLARWYGRDPFKQRRGVVRVVPEDFDMEEEGSPHWWAGGFQKGHITTVHFTCGTIEGLGHTLTHELTHRFDGALFPGLPAWLLEGRAVWTGGAYRVSGDQSFVPNQVSFGTVEAAYIKGYGSLSKLKQLLAGTISDYRDNYTAGYALYVYLNTWQERAQALFARRLQGYMQALAQGRGNPLGRFTRFFADGKQGRPASLKSFAKGFHAFLKGFYWQSRAAWTSRYTQLKHLAGPLVFDHPAWTWSRNRSEPFFGQDQFRRMGELLLKGGRLPDAAAAFCWALHVDEWTPETTHRAARILDQEHQRGAAWVLRLETARLFPGPSSKNPGPPPFKGRLSACWSLLGLMRKAVSSYQQGGQPLVAAALAADHDRLARILGARELKLAPPSLKSLKGLRHPFNAAPRNLGLKGYTESGLAGFEERRVPGLWYVTETGDLVVGRKQPRKGTGSVDHFAAQRDAFTRTREWFPSGRYRITLLLHPTTSFVSGAVILGYARRDREVRLHWSTGDYLYAIGASKKKPRIKSVGASFSGLRPRDGPLWGSRPRRTIRFKNPLTSFRLEFLVDGPQVTAYIENQLVGTYAEPDGQPVEGFLGFAASFGAYRVQEPTIQLMDRHKNAGLGRPWPRGLDLQAGHQPPLSHLVNLPVRGVPRQKTGVLLLLMPLLKAGADEDPLDKTARHALSWAFRAQRLLQADRLAQPFFLAVPDVLGAARMARLQRLGASPAPFSVHIITHHLEGDPDPSTNPKKPRQPRPLFAYLDPRGLLRAFLGSERVGARLPGPLLRWCKVFTPLPPLLNEQQKQPPEGDDR